jgi:hypothetical protein
MWTAFQHALPPVCAVTTVLQRNLLWECRLETAGSRSWLSAVWHERYHIYISGMPVCAMRTTTVLSLKHEHTAYTMHHRKTPRTTPLFRTPHKQIWLLDFVTDTLTVLSVFFVHENVISKNAVNTELKHTNDAHVVNRRVTSTIIRMKHKSITKCDVCVLTAMLLEIQAFWHVTPYRCVNSYWYFESSWCLHLQDQLSVDTAQHLNLGNVHMAK